MFLDEIITHEIGHVNQNNYWRKLDGRSYLYSWINFLHMDARGHMAEI
jgi:predicted Zn-dependent protease